MDANAPASWRKIIEDESFDDFANLDEGTKHEISRWNSQRVGLVQKRMQQELETKLEELDIEILKPSKPFLRVLVTTDIHNNGENCLARNEGSQAFVTIWDPSPDQLDVLHMGAAIRVKNLYARGHRYEGLRQFSGGPHTSILPISIFPRQESATILQRKYTSLFSLHVQSKKSFNDPANESIIPDFEVSVVGIFLGAQKHGVGDDWFVYLTDKSHLLLKVHCVNPCDKLRNFLENGLATELPAVVEFRNTRVVEFNHIEQCAVVTYTRESTFSENPCSDCTKILFEWSTSDDGDASIQKLKLYLKLGVHELNNFQAHQNCAIGYISGLFVVPSQPELIVKVDCGSPYLHTWRFPLALIQTFISTCDFDELRKDVVLNEDEETQLAKLTKVGQIFGSRKKLFRFKLCKASVVSTTYHDQTLEISHVSIVDINALVAMYSYLKFC